MSIATLQPLPPRAAYTDEPIFRLTVDQYHRMINTGELTPDDPVELLEGILVFKMPKNTRHATALRLIRRNIEPILSTGWFYDQEQPITLADGEPEPDVIVVRGDAEAYFHRHPGPSDLALVVEVADASLGRDRGIKLRSYARAGIAQYWILNLIDRQLEVYTDPDVGTPTPTYRGREVIPADGKVSFAIADQAPTRISIASLLPSA